MKTGRLAQLAVAFLGLLMSLWGCGDISVLTTLKGGGTVSTLAGSVQTKGSSNGTGSAAQFNGPAGITTDGTNLYVVDQGNNAIRMIAIATGAVTTLAGNPGSSGSNNGTGSLAEFAGPVAITTDNTNLYVTDGGAIRKIVIATGVVTTMPLSAALYGPTGIATDGTNLYVVNSNNQTISEIAISSSTVSPFAGTADHQGSSNGTGTAAQFTFSSPPSGGPSLNGMATDGVNLYVADTGNDTIRKIVIATQAVSTLAGSPGNSGSSDGTGSAARFNLPSGIATDGTNLYVADYGNNTIRKIVLASGVVTTMVGLVGSQGANDGPGLTARFDSPSGVTTVGHTLYVTDTQNETIRVVK